jgi:DNA-binding transcriptional regulator YdaS (Cro superfamily)
MGKVLNLLPLTRVPAEACLTVAAIDGHMACRVLRPQNVPSIHYKTLAIAQVSRKVQSYNVYSLRTFLNMSSRCS